jgi:hypothetical protein
MRVFVAGATGATGRHPLVAARAIYLSRGFALVEEEAHHSFGVDLVGQVYEPP